MLSALDKKYIFKVYCNFRLGKFSMFFNRFDMFLQKHCSVVSVFFFNGDIFINERETNYFAVRNGISSFYKSIFLRLPSDNLLST